MKSEVKMPRDRDREVKFLETSREILRNQKSLRSANFNSGMLKMVKIVRKVECLLYELLIVALQYWAISGNIGHEIFNPCL